jgi:hypothetical protein
MHKYENEIMSSIKNGFKNGEGEQERVIQRVNKFDQSISCACMGIAQ